MLFCSGKHYYALKARAKELKLNDTVAVVRLEQLAPFPAVDLQRLVSKYSNKATTKFVWAQEEPRNMGAWPFVAPRMKNLCGVEVGE